MSTSLIFNSDLSMAPLNERILILDVYDDILTGRLVLYSDEEPLEFVFVTDDKEIFDYNIKGWCSYPPIIIGVDVDEEIRRLFVKIFQDVETIDGIVNMTNISRKDAQRVYEIRSILITNIED